MSEKHTKRTDAFVVVVLWVVACFCFPLVMPIEAAGALALFGGMLVGAILITRL